MKKMFASLFFVFALISLSLAFQQYAGTVNLNVFNGSTASTNYRWLLNDEPKPINVTIYTGCESAGTCDFIKYVNVSPETMIIDPARDGNVQVSASIPADYDFTKGNMSGYMYARLEGGATGQVTIRLQMGKLINVNVYENVTRLPPVINETAPANASKPPSQPEQPIEFVPLLIAVAIIAILIAVALFLKGMGKPAQKTPEAKEKSGKEEKSAAQKPKK